MDPAAPPARDPAPPLPALFLVSAAAVGYEIALTRYFAVAKWSEYGYWVISIVMVGFALSGVAMALARDRAVRHAGALLSALPPLLIASAALGFWATVVNPFNPLQLQNPATFAAQLGNIALYYAGLLPFFFLAGLYVSLCFVLADRRVGVAYGWDLTGAGAGAALVLVLMWALHPFHLVPALLPLLAAAAFLGPRGPRGQARLRTGLAALIALAAGEGVLLLGDQAGFNEYKAIFAPLHVEGSRVVAERTTPRGLYTLLDDFTERVDTDVSNDAGMLNLPGPPTTFGLYRDGNRIAALPKPGGTGAAYAGATLAALPYALHPGARVLLAGTSGGFRVREALALGAASVLALEPDPVLLDTLRHGLGPAPPLPGDPRVALRPDNTLAVTAAAGGAHDQGGFDLIDLAGDFLDSGEANATAFSAEAIAADLRALTPGGLVSIPVSIREFPAYAVRMLATVRAALLAVGVDRPEENVVVYRSAWNVRILVGQQPWDTARIKAVQEFCDARSFDVSYYPGIDPVAARAKIYNDLPAVSFDAGEVTSGADPHDAVADEAGAALRGEASVSADAFNLAPITLDRPFFYSVLRLDRLPVILQRLEILPQAEIGQLVNLAVLAQSALIALLVLLVPLVAPRVRGAREARAGVARPILYFASLGLGFLFIEITMIERVSFYLNDRTAAFALVLTGMLVFSGLGSWIADRVGGVALPVLVVLAWCALVGFGLEPFVLATLHWPWAARAAAVLAILAPLSVALGIPFPLGLRRAAASGGGFLPWAWGLNGAFSVVATPLANLIAVQAGFGRVLFCAGLLYAIALVAFPTARRLTTWQDIQVPSHDAG